MLGTDVGQISITEVPNIDVDYKNPRMISSILWLCLEKIKI